MSSMTPGQGLANGSNVVPGVRRATPRQPRGGSIVVDGADQVGAYTSAGWKPLSPLRTNRGRTDRRGVGVPETETALYAHVAPATRSTGWFTAASGGSEITAGAAHGQTGDFTLYAQWQINTVALAYDTQGGTGQPDAHVGDAGSTVTVSSIVPTRAGYTFAGWNSQIDGSGSPCLAGDEYTLPMEGSASLFAQWQVTPQPLLRPPPRLRRQPRRPPQLRRRPRWRQPPPPRRLRRRPALCRHHRPPRLLLHQLPAPQPSPARSPKGRP